TEQITRSNPIALSSFTSNAAPVIQDLLEEKELKYQLSNITRIIYQVMKHAKNGQIMLIKKSLERPLITIIILLENFTECMSKIRGTLTHPFMRKYLALNSMIKFSKILLNITVDGSKLYDKYV